MNHGKDGMKLGGNVPREGGDAQRHGTLYEKRRRRPGEYHHPDEYPQEQPDFRAAGHPGRVHVGPGGGQAEGPGLPGPSAGGDPGPCHRPERRAGRRPEIRHRREGAAAGSRHRFPDGKCPALQRLHPAGRFRGRRGPGSGPRRGPPGGTLRGGRLPDRRREPRRAGLDEPLVGFAVRSGPRLRPHDARPAPASPRPRSCRI